MSAIVEAISTRLQRSPRLLRLITGFARRISPVIVTRSGMFALGADEVREVFSRPNEFELGPVGARKMLMGPFLLGMDPREQYFDERRLLAKILEELHTPVLETIAREESNLAVQAFATKDSIEVVSEFAELVVTRIASRFFGVNFPDVTQSRVLVVRTGEELLAQWLRKVGSVIATTSPAPAGLQGVAEACAPEFRAHLTGEVERTQHLIDEGRATDTVLARLLQCVQAGTLPLDRVVPNLAGLMLAGSTALVKSVVHALDQILKHPDEIERAIDDTSIHALVFEALRFNPTFPVLLRYCPRSTRVGEGQDAKEVPAGASVSIVPFAAMFDGEVADADRFYSQRRPGDTLLFGWGQHKCLGRDVATSELIAMFRALLRLPHLADFTGSRIGYDGPAADRFVIRRTKGRP